jgi:hypothetical protein
MSVVGRELLTADQVRNPPKAQPPFGPVYKVVRSTLAVVLLVATWLKGWSPSEARVPGVWNLAGSSFLAGLQLAVAAWLLSGLAETWSRRAAVLLMAVFALVAGWRFLEGKGDCGCFGAVRVPPALTFAFDLGSLVALLWLGRVRIPIQDADGRLRSPSGARAGFVIGICFASWLLVTARLAVARHKADSIVVLEPSSWNGKPFPVLAYIGEQAGGDLSAGKRTVILFDRRCEACRTYLDRISREWDSPEATITRLIDLAPNGDATDGFSPPFAEVPLRPGVLCAADVPLKVSLSNGIVVAVIHPK